MSVVHDMSEATGSTYRGANTDGIYRHAYDPVTQPEYFEGVLARRTVAFMVDAAVILAPIALLAIFIFVFGIVTLSLGWMLFPILGPALFLWAILYCAITLGSSASATLGMRLVDIELRTWYGSPCYSLLGALHIICFWVLLSALTPLVLIVPLFNNRRRLLHDFLLGTVMVNTEARAAMLRRN